VERTIVVGDVHGCRAELEELLSKLALGSEDALYFVGDLIARGPDGVGVLDLAARLEARSVMGNHERRLLHARAARARGERGPRLGPSHERLLAELGASHWEQLEALPLWLDVSSHPLRIVHAGVVPGVPIQEQDPWALTHMRCLSDDGKPTDARGATLWGERYREEPHVVFGHNAVDGLQLHSRATGLDTGCVYGGRLTALVLPAGEPVPKKKDRPDVLRSVRARAAYVEIPPGA
jgi:hypothetical protein